MEKAKVYFTDFRTKANGDGLPTKLKKLIKKAGIADLDLDGKFVAIKMHFGELGNISYLRPNYARAVVEVVKELGGKPFLTDCNTLYPGSRKNALEHLYCAWENGFTPLTVGCPIIIGDGLKGTDDIEVPVNYELMAFEWAEANVIGLNERCNNAVGEGKEEMLILADELPVLESWESICTELSRAGLENLEIVPEGIKIKFMH